MKADIILLSGSFDDSAIRMTNNTLHSLYASEEDKDLFNVILVESVLNSKEEMDQKDVKYVANEFIFPNEKFNYNRFLNFGSTNLKGDYVVITNNDVIFYDSWFTNAVRVMKDASLDSCSCLSPGWVNHDCFRNSNLDPIYGFRTGYEFCGWNLIFKREVYDSLLPLDEQFDYCFQDDDIAMRLQLTGRKHGLILSSKVRHLVSRSRKYFDQNQFDSDYRRAEMLFQRKYS